MRCNDKATLLDIVQQILVDTIWIRSTEIDCLITVAEQATVLTQLANIYSNYIIVLLIVKPDTEVR